MAATGSAVAIAAAAAAGLTLAGFASAASQGLVDHKNGTMTTAAPPPAAETAAPAGPAEAAAAQDEARNEAVDAAAAQVATTPDPVNDIVERAIKNAMEDEAADKAKANLLENQQKALASQEYGGTRRSRKGSRRRARGGYDRAAEKRMQDVATELKNALKVLSLGSKSPRPAFMKLITVTSNQVAVRLLPVFDAFIKWRSGTLSPGVFDRNPTEQQKLFATALLGEVRLEWSKINQIFRGREPIKGLAPTDDPQTAMAAEAAAVVAESEGSAAASTALEGRKNALAEIAAKKEAEAAPAVEAVAAEAAQVQAQAATAETAQVQAQAAAAEAAQAHAEELARVRSEAATAAAQADEAHAREIALARSEAAQAADAAASLERRAVAADEALSLNQAALAKAREDAAKHEDAIRAVAAAAQEQEARANKAESAAASARAALVALPAPAPVPVPVASALAPAAPVPISAEVPAPIFAQAPVPPAPAPVPAPVLPPPVPVPAQVLPPPVPVPEQVQSSSSSLAGDTASSINGQKTESSASTDTNESSLRTVPFERVGWNPYTAKPLGTTPFETAIKRVKDVVDKLKVKRNAARFLTRERNRRDEELARIAEQASAVSKHEEMVRARAERAARRAAMRSALPTNESDEAKSEAADIRKDLLVADTLVDNALNRRRTSTVGLDDGRIAELDQQLAAYLDFLAQVESDIAFTGQVTSRLAPNPPTRRGGRHRIHKKTRKARKSTFRRSRKH